MRRRVDCHHTRPVRTNELQDALPRRTGIGMQSPDPWVGVGCETSGVPVLDTDAEGARPALEVKMFDVLVEKGEN